MSRTEKIVIAIDGPAGSGKSSTAKNVAELLNYTFLDSGAMYRAVTLAVLRQNTDLRDEQSVVQIADACDIQFQDQATQQRVLLNGEDVSEAIRTPDVTKAIAPVAANPKVRKILVKKQRQLGESGGIVAEGRDMTSVVFPHAEIKVFMQASLDERARRRRKDLLEQGKDVPLRQVKMDIQKRDSSDSEREHGALVKVKDALVIDTSNLSIQEQVDLIVEQARKKGA